MLRSKCRKFRQNVKADAFDWGQKLGGPVWEGHSRSGRGCSSAIFSKKRAVIDRAYSHENTCSTVGAVYDRALFLKDFLSNSDVEIQSTVGRRLAHKLLRISRQGIPVISKWVAIGQLLCRTTPSCADVPSFQQGYHKHLVGLPVIFCKPRR